MVIVECIKKSKGQADVNPHILHMLEGICLLDAAQLWIVNLQPTYSLYIAALNLVFRKVFFYIHFIDTIWNY